MFYRETFAATEGSIIMVVQHLHSAKTLQRGIEVIEHQNQTMNSLSPEQVEAQLNVGAFVLSLTVDGKNPAPLRIGVKLYTIGVKPI